MALAICIYKRTIANNIGVWVELWFGQITTARGGGL